MKNFMIDLETLSTRQDAAVTQIGVVSFDDDGNVGEGRHWRIDINDAIRYGHVDGDTVAWWLKQSEEARAQFNLPPTSMHGALSGLSYFLSAQASEFFVWGNGPIFDVSALMNAYQKLEWPLPWTHKNVRCYRTLKNLFPKIELVREGVFHHALDDARTQAKHASLILKHIKELESWKLSVADSLPSGLPPGGCFPSPSLDAGPSAL